MNQGDIVLVPFPYTNLTSIKTRPALVISKNNHSDDVILLAISSKKSLMVFEIDNNSLNKGSLPLISFVKIDKVVSLKKSIIIKKVASLNSGVCEKVVRQFKQLF